MPATFSAVPDTISVVIFESRTHIEPGTVKTFELLSIIGSIAAVGVALAAIVIGSNANLRTEMHGLRTEMRADIRAVESRLSAVENGLSAVEQRQARTEGLVEGLRDAVTARTLQDPPAQGKPASAREPA